jgi:uncharacterized repeat protein (TIGR03803 family)
MQTLSFARHSLAFTAIVVAAGCGMQSSPLQAALPQQAVTLRRPPANSGYKVLYSFRGGKDGQSPNGGLIYVGGKLYGATLEGGNPSCVDGYGCGTVFSATTAGKESVIYGFAGGGKDGAYPASSLIDFKGQLYGTTGAGGTLPSISGGTVYKVSTSGTERVLYSFQKYGDGTHPEAKLLGIGSTLYGTTSDGGVHSCYSRSCGTIFSVSTTGKERVLHSFQGYPNDGTWPFVGLTEVNGALFGVTQQGGAGGQGSIFRSSLSGEERMIYSFKPHDGWFPDADLLLLKGKLYGTGSIGGAYGYGAVFEITPAGKEQVIYTFKGAPRDGSGPNGALVEVSGNFYGVTGGGGAYQCSRNYDCGTVFKLSPSGQETVLYNFKGGHDGAYPIGGLVEVNGVLYGATSAGGSGMCAASGSGPAGCGTIFKISP